MVDLKLVRNEVEAAVVADLRTNWRSLAHLSRKHNVSPEFVRALQKQHDPHERNKNVVKIPNARRSIAPPAPARAGLALRAYALGVAAVGLLLGGVGLVLNYQFARSLGRTESAGYLLGALGVAVDGTTIVLPTVCFFLWEQRHRFYSILSGVIWGLCLGLSLIAGMNFAGSNIGDSLLSRATVVTDRQALTLELAAVKTARAQITEDRNPQDLEDKIQLARGAIGKQVLIRSNECSDITLPASAAACAEVLELRKLKRNAERSAELRIELDSRARQLSDKIASLPSIAVADPGADQVTRVTGGYIEQRSIETFWMLGLGLMPSLAGFLLAFARILGRSS